MPDHHDRLMTLLSANNNDRVSFPVFSCPPSTLTVAFLDTLLGWASKWVNRYGPRSITTITPRRDLLRSLRSRPPSGILEPR